MTRSIVPKSVPGLPEEGIVWLRSTRGHGGMYHVHTGLGGTACGSIRLDRYHSEPARHLGDFQYWGVCPRCLAKVPDLAMDQVPE